MEFLEKKLNITDRDAEAYKSNGPQTGSSFRTSGTEKGKVVVKKKLAREAGLRRMLMI